MSRRSAPTSTCCFAKRPEFELYDLRTDPMQVNNLADDPAYGETLRGPPEAPARERPRPTPATLAPAGGAPLLEGHRYLGGGGGKWPLPLTRPGPSGRARA